MKDSEAPLALIRTRPLGQGNYGGILQAFALQRALSTLGIDSVTDLSPGVTIGASGLNLARIKGLVKGVLARLGLPGVGRKAWVIEAARPSQDQPLTRFVSRQLRTVNLYDSAGRIDSHVLQETDLFITGSDQVWRAAFGRVPTYLFDFLANDDTRPRIAYAASFGTDADEYGSSLTQRTRELAQRLTAASVREASGRELARRLWGIDAVQVLDPTMLLDVSVYSAIADIAADRADALPLLTTYVLDAHPSTQQTIASVSGLLKASPTPLLPPPPPTYRAYRANPNKYSRLSVEAWLKSIRDAEFVVTDSFHGTVFSIMFNTPFVAIVNRERGTARFESLLATLSLSDRLVDPGYAVKQELVHAPIDWVDVNERIAEQRAHSMEFLRFAVPSGNGSLPRDDVHPLRAGLQQPMNVPSD